MLGNGEKGFYGGEYSLGDYQVSFLGEENR